MVYGSHCSSLIKLHNFQLRIKYWIPGAIFAGLSTLAAFVTLLEPETVGRNLPESIDEVDNWTITISKEERATLKEQNEKRKALRNASVIPTSDIIPQEKPTTDSGQENVATATPGQENGAIATPGQVNVAFEDENIRL